jgi:hypothetical protein
MTGPEYYCARCGKSNSRDEYVKYPFCSVCGIHLSRKSLSPAPFKVNGLFKEFMQLEGFTPGEGVCYDNVPLWIAARKRAYAKYREKFAVTKLLTGENWRIDFKDFLYFKNNQSWSTFTRVGLDALKESEQLRKLLINLQDESIRVEKRVQDALQGEKHVNGITQNILTGLLHTFHPDKYGAWNNRTDDALQRIKRNPIKTSSLGKNYIAINEALARLAKDLDTDLTTIDGFMWYISKN